MQESTTSRPSNAATDGEAKFKKVAVGEKGRAHIYMFGLRVIHKHSPIKAGSGAGWAVKNNTV